MGSTPAAAIRIPLWSRKLLAFVLKFGVTAALLYVVFSKVAVSNVLGRMREIAPITIGLVVILLTGHMLGSVVRWRMVVGCLGGKVGWRPVLSATLLERLVNQALPSTVSGDASRVMILMRSGLPVSKAFLSVLFDRALAVGGIVIAVVMGLPLAFRLFPDRLLLGSLLWVIGISGLSLAAVLVFPSALLERITLIRWLRHIAGLIKTTKMLFAIPRFSIQGLGMSVLIQVFLALAFQLIAHDLGAHLSFAAVFVAVPVMSLIGLIPLTLAGWGVRESAAVLLLPYVGVSPENALAISILYGLLGLAVGCAGAVFWLIMEMDNSTPGLVK